MTTSGSTNFTATRNQIITRALRLLGVVPQGELPTAEMISEASEALNSMVKYWQNEHVFLWASDWSVKTLTASGEVIGTDGKNYTCLSGHTSAAANRPITGAEWTTYWYLGGSSGSTWNSGTAYTAIGEVQMDSDIIDVTKAFVRDDHSDWPLALVRLEDFMDIYDKTRTGIPTHAMVRRSEPSPLLYLYPQPDMATYVLHFIGVRALEDFDVVGNTPDLPVRWIDPLVFGLAAALGPEYGLKIERQQYLDAKAAELRRVAKRNDTPTHSGVFAQPAFPV